MQMDCEKLNIKMRFLVGRTEDHKVDIETQETRGNYQGISWFCQRKPKTFE